MPIAFLTGGTGFVGGHVARALCQEGWRVRMLARDSRRAEGPLLEGLSFEVVSGDLNGSKGLAEAISGADAIVHVAGLVKARTLEEYRGVNLRGTEYLLAAARESAPAALFLNVSSQAAAGPARGGRPVAEGDRARPISWYGLSKREGELSVERSWRGPWVNLRPGVVFGPGDRGLFSYFQMAAAGWIPLPAGQSRIQLIGAERAALGIARAVSRPELWGRTGFLCDPEPVRLASLATQIASLPRRRARVVPVPNAAVRLLGFSESLLERLTRRSRPFNADKAREILAGDWLCDGAPVRQAVDLPAAPPLSEELRAAWDWYRAAGWLPGARL
jgi:2-alkyl-3-oxoalkanoate reductase